MRWRDEDAERAVGNALMRGRAPLLRVAVRGRRVRLAMSHLVSDGASLRVAMLLAQSFYRARPSPGVGREYLKARGVPWALRKIVVGATRAKAYSYHSLRVYLACALLASGALDAGARGPEPPR